VHLARNLVDPASRDRRRGRIVTGGEQVRICHVPYASLYRTVIQPECGDAGSYRDLLLGGPKLDDGTADVFAEIEAERKADFGRVVDLEAGT
jgi:hypothetical protein